MPQRSLRTDIKLPWPEPDIPAYREGKYRAWSIGKTPSVSMTAGYFLPVYRQPEGWVIKHKGKSVWMSLTRMEIESHMPHLAAARGRVVIAGLGMGFALYNIAKKREVTHITVLEQNPDIPKLLDKCTDWQHWPGREKIEIHLGDATQWVADDEVDFLYADIWPHVWDDNALAQTQQMQRNINAKLVGYWSQEGDFIKGNKPTLSSYRAWVKQTGLPLIEQNNPLYPSLAFAAITLQIMASKKGDSLDKTMLADRYNQFLAPLVNLETVARRAISIF